MMNQNVENDNPVSNNQANNWSFIEYMKINTFKSIPTYLKIINIVRNKSINKDFLF